MGSCPPATRSLRLSRRTGSRGMDGNHWGDEFPEWGIFTVGSGAWFQAESGPVQRFGHCVESQALRAAGMVSRCQGTCWTSCPGGSGRWRKGTSASAACRIGRKSSGRRISWSTSRDTSMLFHQPRHQQTNLIRVMPSSRILLNPHRRSGRAGRCTSPCGSPNVVHWGCKAYAMAGFVPPLAVLRRSLPRGACRCLPAGRSPAVGPPGHRRAGPRLSPRCGRAWVTPPGAAYWGLRLSPAWDVRTRLSTGRPSRRCG